MRKDWVAEKVDISNINRGKEYIIDDNLEISAINSIIKNSIYASEIADEVLNKIENFNPELATEYVTQTEFKETKNDLLSKIQVNTNSIVYLNEGVVSNTESISNLQEQINNLEFSPEEIGQIKQDISEIKTTTLPSISENLTNLAEIVESNTTAIETFESYKQIVDEHTIQIGVNETNINNNKEEIDKLKEDIGNLSISPEEIANLKTTVNQASAKVDELDTKVGGFDSRITENSTNITKNTENIGKNTEEISNISTSITEINTTLNTHSSQIVEINQRIDGLDISPEEINSLKESVSKIPQIEQDLETNKTNISNNSKNIENLQTEFSEFSDSITDFNERINQNSENITKNTGSIDQHTQQIANINAQLDNLQISPEEIEYLKQSVRDLSSEIPQIKSDITTNTNGVSANRTSIDGLSSQITAQCELISNNATEISQNREQISSHTSQISQINSRIDNLDLSPEDVADLKASVDQFSEDIGKLQESVTGNTSNIASNTESINESKSAIETNRLNIESNTQTINAHSTTIGEHTTQISTNTTDITELKQKVNTNIEYVEELPTADADSPDFVNLSKNADEGILFRKRAYFENKEITDLTGTTWVLVNDMRDWMYTGDFFYNMHFSVNFICDGVAYSSMSYDVAVFLKYDGTFVNDNGWWMNQKYRTITFTSDNADIRNALLQGMGEYQPPILYQYIELQDKLVSGKDIKTFNGIPILGKGNIEIDGVTADSELSLESENAVQNKVITEALNSKVRLNGDDDIYGVKSFDVIPKLGVQQGLQEEYQEVDYIESTGTQWINTGVSMSDNITKIETSYYRTTTGNTQILFGMYDGNTYSYFDYTQGRLTQEIVWNKVRFASNTVVGINKYDSTLEITNNKLIYTINNSTVAVAYNGGTSTSTYPFYLFADNSNGSAICQHSCKLYFFKIWSGENLLRNYIPCYRKNDNVVGLYDTVTQLFYENIGTGDFLKGENVYRGVDFATVDNLPIINSGKEPTGVLNTITMNGETYSVPSGGGGSGGSGGSSLPIGSIFASALPQTDTGFHLLDGSTILLDGIYKDFVNLVKTIINAGYNLTCTQEEYDACVITTGSCGKFVLDEINNTLRLPIITTFVQGLTDLTNIGNSVEAGLPNITGTIHYATDINISNKGTLIDSWSQNQSADGNQPGTTGNLTGLRAGYGVFDANNINSIYGNSTTVQPPSIQYPYYIVLANSRNSSVVNSQNIYSTEETPIGVWIDGKTIYRKVVEVNQTAPTTISTGLDSNVNITNIIMKNTYSSSDSSICFNVALKGSDLICMPYYLQQSNMELVRLANSITAYVYFVVLEYTKTTD